MAVQGGDSISHDNVADKPAPAVPDYLATPNAVFGDEGVQWRYGKAPDYSKTRKVWAEGKKRSQSFPLQPHPPLRDQKRLQVSPQTTTICPRGMQHRSAYELHHPGAIQAITRAALFDLRYMLYGRVSFLWSSNELFQSADDSGRIMGSLTCVSRKAYESRARKSARDGGEPRQELGSRSIVQAKIV